MDRIKRILEIDDLHPHMFRYSHATVLHELGVDNKTIQHWEGHANQATTANIYIKNTQTMTDRAEAILSDFASANAPNFIFQKNQFPLFSVFADHLADF